MSKDSTKRTTNQSTSTTGGSAETLANANTLWNLGLQNATAPAPVYGGQLTAGLSPDQQAAFGLIRDNTTTGQPQLNTATDLAGQAGAYTPQQITPGVSAGAQAIPAGTGVAAMGPAASGGVATSNDLPSVDLSQYMNPYTQNVIAASLQGINNQEGITQNANAGAAAAHGAFGDSRSGVQAALTSSLFDQNKQSTIAGLNSANYTQATGNAEADLARREAASAATAGNATTAGVANVNAGTNANIASANNNLGLASTNANLAQNNNQFNVNTGLTAAINNQNAGLQGNAQTLAAASTLGNLGMSAQQQVLNAANAEAAAGGVAQGTQQAGLTAQYNAYLQQQGYSQEQIANLMNIFDSTQGATGSVTNTRGSGTETTPVNIAGSLLGAAGTVLGGPIGGAIAKKIIS